MKKLSPNAPCPCCSGLKYKKCCRPCHLGKWAPDALTLMRSRYSAYALGDVSYIMKTTHPEHPDVSRDPDAWSIEIYTFCRETEFTGLKILDVQPGEEESFVTFHAQLGEKGFQERSRFLLHDGRWLYREAVDLQVEPKAEG